jgi:sulfatase maturation enzyme AslB (radical SAM superfamily)
MPGLISGIKEIPVEMNENVYDLKDVQISIPNKSDIRKLYVELTGDCNFSCEMCFRHSFPETLGSMDDHLLGKLCREIESLPELREIIVGGIGEPFLHPALPAFVDGAFQPKYRGYASYQQTLAWKRYQQTVFIQSIACIPRPERTSIVSRTGTRCFETSSN